VRTVVNVRSPALSPPMPERPRPRSRFVFPFHRWSGGNLYAGHGAWPPEQMRWSCLQKSQLLVPFDIGGLERSFDLGAPPRPNLPSVTTGALDSDPHQASLVRCIGRLSRRRRSALHGGFAVQKTSPVVLTVRRGLGRQPEMSRRARLVLRAVAGSVTWDIDVCRCFGSFERPRKNLQ